MSPLRRTSWKLSAFTFLAVPNFVTIMSESSPCFFDSFGIGRIEVTFSLSASERKLTKALPFVARLPSGNSYILI